MPVELIVLLAFCPLYAAVIFRWCYEATHPGHDMWDDWERWRSEKAKKRPRP